MTTMISNAKAGLWAALPVTAALGPLLAVGPLLAFRALAAVAVVAGLIAVARTRRISVAQRWILALIATVTASAAMTWVWPTWQVSGLVELLSVILGLLLASAAIAPDERPWSWIARGVVLTVLIEAGIVLWEVRSGLHLPTFALTWDDDRYMGMWFLMAGSFANPNQLAHVVTVCFPITIWALVSERSLFGRAVALLAVLLCPWMMWLTGSRLGLGVLGLEVCAMMLLLRRGWIALTAMASLGTAALALVPGLLDKVMPGSTKEVDDARLNLTLSGIEMLRKTYGLGVGPGGFSSWASSPRISVETYGLTNAHNATIEVLSQYGVFVALFGLLLMIHVMLTAAPRLRSAVMSDRSLGLGVLIVLSCWPLIGMMNSQWMPLSWSVCELLLLAAAYNELRRTHN